eukprot:4594482-Amphidinium_carterae.1
MVRMLGPIETTKHYSIHRPAPTFTEMGSGAQQLLTGIKSPKQVFNAHTLGVSVAYVRCASGVLQLRWWTCWRPMRREAKL